MGKITSNSGKSYTTHKVSNQSFGLTDENGNKSVYAFEDDGAALKHVNGVEEGAKIDVDDFGKQD